MIYQSFYDLIYPLFSGATAVSYVELVCTLLATICTVFVIAIPFIIVWKVIQTICGR